jgi:predicted transposase/invertase (TIGR01784 family)
MGQEIISIEYLTPELIPANPLGKNSIVDVRCTDNFGRMFIVEMQTEWTNIFRKRLIINGSKALVRQMDKQKEEDIAKRFQDLQPVYILAVVNSEFSKGKDWYHILKIINPKDHTMILDGLEYVLLELPKFVAPKRPLANKRLAVLWLRFLKEIDGYYSELPKEFTSNKLISKAIEKCAEAALTPEERDAYERAKEQAIWDSSIKGLEDAVIEKDKIIADKDQTISEISKELADKDNAVSELAKELADKDNAVSELAKELAEMKKRFGLE